MSRYVALLRGINVGGKNVIAMTNLKACFEEHGFEDVRTYIQSGNVLFESAGVKAATLTRRIEEMLSDAFDYRASIVLRSHRQLENVVARAPEGFGTQHQKYRYDVLFLKEPLTAGAAIEVVPTREGVDRAYAGTGVLYVSRLIRKASSSRISKLASMPIYQQMTIRNWNTTTKLLALMDGASRARNTPSR